MQKILIAYGSNSGSTAEVAQAVAAELSRRGQVVEVLRLEEVSSLDDYGAVVVGAPMIFGWQRAARRFVKTHREALSRLPVAYFATAMRLTTVEMKQPGLPDLFLDPGLACAPKNPPWMSVKERFTNVSSYLNPMLKAASAVKPVSVAFFGGKLEIFRLKWWQALFVVAVVRAQPGDLRNWEAIKKWSFNLNDKLTRSEKGRT